VNYDQREKLTAQIQGFCDANHWEWRILQPHNIHGMMYVEFGYFESPAIHGAKSPIFNYYIGMHELGHMVHGHTQGRPPKSDEVFYFTNGVLRSEAQAWEWAMDNALVEPDEFTRNQMWYTCMGSYYNGGFNHGRPRLMNGNRDYCPEGVVWDKADDYFWSVKERMLEGVS
jgi:hypothetical protein